jgi:outer membrane protein TolC
MKPSLVTSAAAAMIMCMPHTYAQAKTSEPQPVLTWSESVDLATKRNLELSIARQNLEAAEEELKVAQAQFGPEVYLYGKNELYHRETMPDMRTMRYGVGVEQNLFNGFHHTVLVNKAEMELKRQETLYSSASVEVAHELKTVWASIRYLEKAARLAEEIVKRRKEGYDLVSQRYEGGLENSGAVELAAAYLDVARIELQELQAERLQSTRNLQILLGLESWTYESIEELRPEAVEKAPQDFKSLAERHPRARIVEYEKNISRLVVQESESRFWPTLDLLVERGSSDDRVKLRHEEWNVIFSLKVPLFSSGRDYHARESARHGVLGAVFQEEKTSHELVRDLETSFQKLSDAHRRVELNRKIVRASQLRSDIAKNRYRSGLGTFDEWNLIETELISNLKSQIEAERTVLQSEADWQRAQGKGFGA